MRCLCLLGGLIALQLAASADQLLPLIAPERIEEIRGWLPARPAAGIPTFADRAFWSHVSACESAQTLLREAEEIAGQPMPELTEALFNEFRSTGIRRNFDRPYAIRLHHLRKRVLAEGIENRGRFLPEIEESITVLLDEPSWIIAAHAGNRKTWADTYDHIDLGAAARVWTLAMSDWLLADRIKPDTRRRIREEAEARVFRPYRERVRSRDRLDFHWMDNPYNWNAVCNAGVLGAALLLLDSPRDRAEFAAAFEAYSRFYISGFGDDGSCEEGPSYWEFGFGHFLVASEALREATGGHLNLLDEPKIRRIAEFGSRMQLVEGINPPFGDVVIGHVAEPWILDFAALHYHVGSVQARPSLTTSRLFFTTFDLMFPREPNSARGDSLALRDWFPDAEMLVARQRVTGKGLSIAVKGGHNGVPHNHNDIGSYVVANGSRLILTDLGAEVPYVRDSFGPRRYASGMTNSFGHPVPRVAGTLQSAGKQARAEIIRSEFTDTEDVVEMDTTAVYDTKHLKRLVRKFRFSRIDGGSLEVEDRVVFHSEQLFDTAIILQPKQSIVPVSDEESGRFRVAAVEESDAVYVHCSTESCIPLTFTKEPIMGLDSSGDAKGIRFGIGLSIPIKEAVIRVRITPSSGNDHSITRVPVCR